MDDFFLDCLNALLQIEDRLLILLDVQISIANVLVEKTGIIIELFEDMNSLNVFEYFVGIVAYKVLLGCISKQLIDYPHFFIDLDNVLCANELRYFDSDVVFHYKFAVIVYLEQLQIQIIQDVSQHHNRYHD